MRKNSRKADSLLPQIRIFLLHLSQQQGFGPKLPENLNEHQWSGLRFHISSGECPCRRMGCQVEGRFPHSALSIYLQQLAAGNVQTPTFVHSFSKPTEHRLLGTACGHAELAQRARSGLRVLTVGPGGSGELKKVFTPGTLKRVLLGCACWATLGKGRLVLWLPIGCSPTFFC